ncbi:hypothetical protein [Streptomyces sp. PanSC9]|uniref:hypothetical protein n=1 Tax=Streptomyces sp. PanSC9 TaxID=1520461 RepID=UPI000F482F41|nr:hypothetical protein [Streptomyces sp. PanSC9]ROP50627.1 hypothetical protein EDD94_0030 [Streptomyces sp. PanSC9]
MDALTQLNVLGLVLSAVLLAMACVRADRMRGRRTSVDPPAPEIPDAAFVVARVVLVTLAGLGVHTAVQGFGVSDDASWNDSELTNAVHRATDEPDGHRFRTDEAGSPLHFDDYASLTEDKVARDAGGDAPETGVAVTPAVGDTAAGDTAVGGSFTATVREGAC